MDSEAEAEAAAEEEEEEEEEEEKGGCCPPNGVHAATTVFPATYRLLIRQ